MVDPMFMEKYRLIISIFNILHGAPLTVSDNIVDDKKIMACNIDHIIIHSP
jgi:hypothetical protein